MDGNMTNVDGGNIQGILAAPIAIPLLFVALILILVSVLRLSNGEWMSGFTLFIVGGILAFFGKTMMYG